MKKFIFVCLILFLLLVSFKLITSAKEKDARWTKINTHLYIDKSSITQTVDGASAWFKFYNPLKTDAQRDKIDGVSIYYDVIKYQAACKLGALFITHTKYYSKNKTILFDEVNTHDVGGDCGAYIDGEIICKTLCAK